MNTTFKKIQTGRKSQAMVYVALELMIAFLLAVHLHRRQKANEFK